MGKKGAVRHKPSGHIRKEKRDEDGNEMAKASGSGEMS